VILLAMQQDLNEQQGAGIPALVRTKKDSTCDFLTIFTIRVWVSFKKNGKIDALDGRWCTVCK
jgi:hypothetical protein